MKTLLLGLDGLDPDLVEEFDLPNIKSIGEPFEINTHGNSGPSWVSVLTGRKPKHHGLFKLQPGQDRNSWTGAPIWEKVDGYSGIANIPLTYPPTTIDGWMVTSVMTPRRTIYTYPRSLYKDLDDLGYMLDVWVEPGKNENHPDGAYGMVPFEFTEDYREELLDQCERVVEKRGEAFCWLIENEPVDFAFLTFTALDRVQHLAFHKQNIIEEFYEQLDEVVGEILEKIPPGTDIFATSDHGFQRVDFPDRDLTGDHRFEGFSVNNIGARYDDLESLHEAVVASANHSEVEQKLSDLGYI